jgi:HK97 family phage major capsid protein
MKWIELTSEYDGKPAGEIFETDDAVADVLVKTKTAKAAQEPAAVASATSELDADSVQGLLDSAVAKAVAKLAPQGKRFSNPADPATVEKKEWATARRCGRLKHFTNDDDGLRAAYRFGQWFRGLCGMKSAADWSIANGMQFVRDTETKANAENNNAAGGFLVPIEFDTTLIDLREKFGIFRASIGATPMTSDTKWIPRRKSGLTATFVGEGNPGAESTKNWDQVQLVAKKIMAITRFSNELGEDAILNIGDDLAGEVAYAFALKEDQCGFIGDGTGTYGGIQGVSTKLFNVDATPANILGLVVGAAGTGASWAGFTLANFNQMIGTLPEYADGPNAKFYVHKTFWGQVMQKLLMAGGGNRVGDLVDGARVKEFGGYEVVVTQVMPKVAANNSVVALFGDLSKAASFGDRRQTSIAVSTHADTAFFNDQVLVRGTERFDIVVHDVGESSAGTARDAAQGLLPGPIVGLATASS